MIQVVTVATLKIEAVPTCPSSKASLGCHPVVMLPMVCLELVVVVDPQMMEEVVTQGGETQTPKTTGALYDEVILCLLLTEPGYTHLVYVRQMNITSLKCMINYSNYVKNICPYELKSLRERKFIELTQVLWGSTMDHLSFWT